MRFWAWTHFEHTKCSVSPHGQEVDLSPYLEGEKGGGDCTYGERVPLDGVERDGGGPTKRHLKHPGLQQSKRQKNCSRSHCYSN